MTVVTVRGIQVREGRAVGIDDPVIQEERLSLFINGEFYARIVASRNNLRELGAGFVVSQGLAKEVDEVVVEGDVIDVRAPVAGGGSREVISTGAIGIFRPFEKVVSSLTLAIQDVYAITEEIETETWRKTGAVHCSVLYSGGRIVARSSDVGRHNTVDKVIGHAVLNHLDRSQCVLGCTGRQPRDMVTKAAHAGIPVVISRAASTKQGIDAAWEAGITLVCFSRKGRFTVYSHPERIRELSGMELLPPSRAGDIPRQENR
jgi:FdhD protein